MLKDFLLSTWIHLLKNKVHSLISILSLTVGLTVFSLLFLYVKHELSYDRSWSGVEKIHRLVIDQNNPTTGVFGVYDSTYGTVLPLLRESFPQEIEYSTRMHTLYGFKVNGERYVHNLTIVEPEFTDIFKLDVLAGNLDYVMQNPGFIAIEETMAKKLFGPSALGVTFRGSTGQGGEVQFEVGAIYRAPEHISNPYRFQMLTPMHDYALPLFGSYAKEWGDVSSNIWLTFAPETNVNSDSIQSRLIEFVDDSPAFKNQLKPGETASDYIKYRFQPLSEVYLNPATNGEGGDLARIITFAVIGLLVLLVGCSNTVSLSLASAIERRKEIGIRKAIGARNRDILQSYLGESLIMALMSYIPVFLLLMALLPVFISLLSINETLEIGIAEALILIAITLFMGFLNGIYPAFVLSRVTPETVLKVNNSVGSKKSISLRSLLVGFQFTFTLILVIATLALYLQLLVTRSQPMGFNAENILAVFHDSNTGIRNTNVLRDELIKTQGLEFVTGAATLPNLNIPNLNPRTMSRVNDQQNIVTLELINVGYDHFELFGIPLIAGRHFDQEHDDPVLMYEQSQESNDPDAISQNIIINRRAALTLGFPTYQDAIDQPVYVVTPGRDEAYKNRAQIIGVVEDNMYGSLHRRPGAEYFTLSSFQNSLMMLKFSRDITDVDREVVEKIWEEVTAFPPANIFFIEERINQAFLGEEREGRLLLICAAIALFLSCVGLYGLAAFSIERGIKEVGVRKVLGASIPAIVTLYLWRFSRPILLSNFIAWPVAIYFVLQWMKRFPYQMDKIWLFPLCLSASTLVLLLSLITVGLITRKAAAANPIESLRYE